MKKGLFLCGAMFALMTFVGCSSDDDPKAEAPTLKLSTNSATIPADGTASTIEVTTNQASWTASRPDNAQWCILKQENNKLIISATVNETPTPNTTEVTVVAGTGADAKTEKVTVTQSAANAYLTVEGLEANTPVKLDAAGTLAELTINTNAANWSATRPDADTWCTLTKDGNKLKISATAYAEDAERKTTVTLSGGATPISFEVVQKGEVPIYAIAIPIDFSKSYVQKVMYDGKKIAEICKEYILTPDASVDEQMVVAYPVVDGKTDLTKGLVIKNGGTIVWNSTDNTCAYTAGTLSDALATIYLKDGALMAEIEESSLDATVEAELLVDTRPSDTKWSYKITKIGTQYWMAENLKARNYLDGTAISKLNGSDWINAVNGAYRYPYSDEATFLANGAYYNGYTMYDDKGLAPEGWIVPSDAEWTKLVKYVGPTASSGKKFRSEVADTWNSGTCTNVTGFSAVAAGCYAGETTGDTESGTRTYWWSTTKGTDPIVDRGKESPKAYPLATGAPGLMNDPFSMQTWVKSYYFGFSIRCVRK